MRTEIAALRQALGCLDSENYRLTHALSLADTCKTLRQLSLESGIPVMTLHDREKVLTLLGRNAFPDGPREKRKTIWRMRQDRL